MAERGERQARVFGLLLRRSQGGVVGTITSRDLVEAWGLTQGGAATELARYQRQGLLHRDREPGPGPPVYRYRLTRTGERKAAWLVGQARLQAQEQEYLPGLEPEVEPEPRVIRPPVHRARVLRPRIQRGG